MPGVAPLLTLAVITQLKEAIARKDTAIDCSLDLGRSSSGIALTNDGFLWNGSRYSLPETSKDRTIYYWDHDAFKPVARFTASLIKLVPTSWGPPTFEIDGIKMLPTARICPYQDAKAKVTLIEPRNKVVLDTCGGLGYFAAWCLAGGATRVVSYEKNPDVLWLRSVNPWSPTASGQLEVTLGDVTQHIERIPSGSIDAALHDPPRFAIAGDLYSSTFYTQLARVLKRGGRLFHYTGSPNKVSRGRNLAGEVITRLTAVGFEAKSVGDGVLAKRR